MADVSPGPDGRERWTSEDEDGRNRDRGQLILVTGLAVAVTLVALVLLLNTVIYTQNLATRGTGVDHGDAVAFRGETKSGVSEVIEAENRKEYENMTLVRANVEEAVIRYDELHSRYSAERGTIADIEERNLSLTNGSLLRQTNDLREFRSSDESGGKANWTLVDNTPEVRVFRMTVSEQDLGGESPQEGFSIRIAGDTGNVWRVYVYDGIEDSSDITVAVKNGTEDSASEVYSTSGSNVTMDLTAGTVNGTKRPEFVWAKDIYAPYDITFRNGTEARGTYALTVNNSSTDTAVNTDHFAGPNEGDSPQSVPIVYDAAFDVHFETATLEFHTRVRVAPGEPE